LGPVARIYHNRPGAANAENAQLLRELDDAVVRAGADDEIRVVILGAEGKHFSSGHDMKSSWPRGTTMEEWWSMEEQFFYDYCLRIWNLPKATIGQVQGAAIAGGFMVVNMCDLIVAAEDAIFADPVLQSIGAPAVEVLIHPWVMSNRKAREMLFTGEPIPAREALASGIINRVVPRERLEEETLALANKIARVPPFAMRLMKRSLNRTQEIQGLRNALSAHFDTHLFGHATQEQQDFLRDGNSLERGKKSVA